MATENGNAEAKQFYATAEKEKQRIESRIRELDNIIRCLYEDRVCGRISVERYDAMAVGYETEQAELKQELASITQKIEEIERCAYESLSNRQERMWRWKSSHPNCFEYSFVKLRCLKRRRNIPELQEIQLSFTSPSNRMSIPI